VSIDSKGGVRTFAALRSKVCNELRREIDAGGDPFGQKESGREAPRFKDLIERYTEVHLPHLSPTNASDQKSMLAKLVAPEWGNKLVTEITPYDGPTLLSGWISRKDLADAPSVTVDTLGR
jgi:hypothetical protein